MDIKKTADGIWAEFGRAKSYNTSIDLYETSKRCQNFYIGKQWEGLNAPDLAKPVFNVLKRVTNYFVAMMVASDVGVNLKPYKKTPYQIAKSDGTPLDIIKEELDATVIMTTCDQIIERSQLKEKSRELLRDAAVVGDAYMYFYFDGNKNAQEGKLGGIECEILDNTNVHFGNPYVDDAQKQPFILISTPRQVESVREEARINGVKNIEQITADSDPNMYTYKDSGTSDLCTVITKLWKEGGTVHAIKVTKDIIIREEWDTGYERYPVSAMCWEKIKNSFHGESAIKPVIANQIIINQLFAMSTYSVKNTAFPKTIYDATKISSWSNKVGQAIGVIGNPNEAIASSFRGADMSNQVLVLIDKVIQNTLELMGASDAALGNVKPDNTSAIIATQQATAIPLQLQQFAYYRWLEDSVRNIIDMMRADYGLRPVSITLTGGEEFDGMFDFSTLDTANYEMKVEIGQSSYWSELTQIQTLDNLFAKGIIQTEDYLEAIPDKYISGKARILKKLKEAMAAQAEAQMMQGGALPPTQGQEVM
jgi:hypothetical protein